MNYKMIRYTLGWLLLFEAAFFLLPIITGLIYGERATLGFVWSLLITGAIGVAATVKKPRTTVLFSRDGFVIVGLSWVLLSLFGMLPFLFTGVITSPVDAFFETASGFTTTGATVFTEVESLPKCILLWRSFTHWVGGMGVLVFIMAFLPLGGGHNINIMKAESPGPSVSKLVPRVRTTALILYVLYFAMTLMLIILLLIGGNSLFSSINVALSTAGTGGFGIDNDSLASYSTFSQITVTVFMLLFSLNFTSYYLALKGRGKEFFSEEIRAFIIIVATVITVITLDTLHNGIYAAFPEALKHAAFNVSSLISTTGFSSWDFNEWPNLSRTLLVLVMFVGACAGSTGGGMKVSRMIILAKGMARELRMTVHPRQVKKITMDKHTVEHETVRSVNAYVVCFVVVYVLSVIVLSFDKTDLVTNFTAVAATINNIGLGLEGVGPSGSFSIFSPASKLMLSFDMIAGRLELFPMLILFSPATYKK